MAPDVSASAHAVRTERPCQQTATSVRISRKVVATVLYLFIAGILLCFAAVVRWIQNVEIQSESETLEEKS